MRSEVIQEDIDANEKLAHQSQKDVKLGFGGKFGVQKDRMDKSAVGFDYHEKLAAHASQKDHSAGFGGKFGVQKDRVDKSAVGWEHHEKVEKHESQKGISYYSIRLAEPPVLLDYSAGFGGKFGVQKDRVDKSSVGWDYHEKVEKHESQKGNFGKLYSVEN